MAATWCDRGFFVSPLAQLRSCPSQRPWSASSRPSAAARRTRRNAWSAPPRSRRLEGPAVSSGSFVVRRIRQGLIPFFERAAPAWLRRKPPAGPSAASRIARGYPVGSPSGHSPSPAWRRRPSPRSLTAIDRRPERPPPPSLALDDLDHERRLPLRRHDQDLSDSTRMGPDRPPRKGQTKTTSPRSCATVTSSTSSVWPLPKSISTSRWACVIRSVRSAIPVMPDTPSASRSLPTVKSVI
jgi:hypothetical protein